MTFVRHLAIGAAAAAAAVALTGGSAAAAPAGHHPHASDGFTPSSTVWATSRHGWVLGYRPQGSGWQPGLLETLDGGSHWRARPAPPVALPDNHNQVKLTYLGGAGLAVTDGTSVRTTRTDGRHWATVRLPGVPANHYVQRIAAGHGRLYALVQSRTGDAAAIHLYTGTTGARQLSAVKGLDASGSGTYGDVDATGAVQVSMGADYRTNRYWTSTDGVHFRTAPTPCPDDTLTDLAAPQRGRVLALCTLDPGFGSAGKQLRTAPALGRPFTATAGAPSQDGLTMGFAAASADVATVAATSTRTGTNVLYGTFDGGRTWRTTLTSEPDQEWTNLAFVSGTVGFAVAGGPDSPGGGTVFRTTDGGRTWAALTVG